MTSKTVFFKNFEELNTFAFNAKKGAFSIKHQNLENYEGMVFYIGVYFNIDKNDYQLNLEWMCLGLDLFGDNLVESYVYQFNTLQSIINYLDKKHQIKVTDIKTDYFFDDTLFPNPIKNKDKKAVYNFNWDQFQKDFKKGMFLDASLPLIYSSLD
ncbi:hypothetical protein [Polaribacter uvawellassae]|uniref:hypothetical protein n=1 Tax=Polaribacter uvawellassae TaxID=3133495 RepID=UPI003219FD95